MRHAGEENTVYINSSYRNLFEGCITTVNVTINGLAVQ